jgi:hypothetical protein
MVIITKEFVDQVIQNGLLAQHGAGRRTVRHDRGTTHAGTDFRPGRSFAKRFWTPSSADWYDGIVAELSRRGFTSDQIDTMRRFAWETVGWLNYDKALWEWCSLDEKDIKLALDEQLREGLEPMAECGYVVFGLSRIRRQINEQANFRSASCACNVQSVRSRSLRKPCSQPKNRSTT